MDGKRLERLMEKKGYTMQSLAAETGLTPTAIRYYLNGSRRPGEESIKVLCKALKVSADYLIGIR